MTSKFVHDEYLRDRSIKSVSKYLHLSCNNTIDIISNFFKTGVLRFENDQSHNRDIFEVGKAFGMEFLTNVFCTFVLSSYKEINKENFNDIYDCASIQNDTKKINECVAFFASNMFDLQEEYKISTIKRYGYDFFERILTSKSLKISSQDSIINTIITLSQNDISFFSLINYVKVEFCSQNVIKSIHNFATKHSLEYISSQVFMDALLNLSTISDKLELPNVNDTSSETKRHKIQAPCGNNFDANTNPQMLQHSNVNEFSTDMKLNISHIEELHKIDNSNENMRKLISLRKVENDFEKIYEILNKASAEGDLLRLRSCMITAYS
ncbi:hypothetical protein TVAG_188190 [Trichomonas vaginalis G3]|uniref:Uncharacterized protein n=1 Tax=Trichomonas vaginalis (strain ATCC PRA-98 / G3) TaxID=412133 RepID=A2DV41_TRIV3|nr:hypothetical protein TVAG_188190 [Trichomonas vaginalis G3]|eukprot:XP_001327991.1 hypothetical protein [Trichomonas vaginalis G3]